MTWPIAPAELVQKSSELGFELCGLVDAGRYDAGANSERRVGTRLRGAATIVVLGTGGRAFWERAQAAGSDLRAAPGHHPIDAFGAQQIEKLVVWLAQRTSDAKVVTLPEDENALDFLRLARLAGFGSISPVLGLLLHERYGPWVSLRGAVLVAGRPFGAIEAVESSFRPCEGCAQPCVTACPASVFDGRGGIDLAACATHRLAAGCPTGCDARRACPVGAEARYGDEEEAFRHAYSRFAMQRWQNG